MPHEQSTSSVGISSSVATFLLITSVCCILSLSTTDPPSHHENHENKTQNNNSLGAYDPPYAPVTNLIRFQAYAPKFAMLGVMSIGIVAMIVFVFMRRSLTTRHVTSSNRHELHGIYSSWGIRAFFIGVCTLSAAYVIVEFSCIEMWNGCGDDVLLVNSSEVIFRVVLVMFASCETLVCWTIKDVNFKQSQWVWHGLAGIQAANVALWFDSVLSESTRRIDETVGSFDAYFIFCNDTWLNRTRSNQSAWCSESSIAGRLFVKFSPLLYPITIEFSLLVSETFLEKAIGAQAHDNAAQAVRPSPTVWRRVTSWFSNVLYRNRPHERAPLLPNPNGNSTVSIVSKIFVLTYVIINIVYVVLSFLIYSGYQSKRNKENVVQSEVYDDILAFYLIFYYLCCTICCAVGIQTCRKFRRPPSPTNFLEYLLLFSISGVLLQSLKRLVAFSVIKHRFSPAYCVVEVSDIVLALVQIVFYYNAKDVKLLLIDDGGSGPGRHPEPDNPVSVAVFKNITFVIAVSNFASWISDSFLLPEMDTSITPSNSVIESWPHFDNVVTPILIFFRFNSALLFWCLGTDVFRPGELHEE